ncbi:MAG: DUF1003 domain-containing protein [Phycisphaerae bacterium]|nr:DUF1003 domain-containing protein [Phycisphaerae bacterium]
MKKDPGSTFTCPICDAIKPITEGRPAEMVGGPIGDIIRREHADWGAGHIICLSCLSRFRNKYLQEAIEAQRGELSAVEKSVLDSLAEQEVLARNINPEFERALTVGEQVADKVSSFGGSWRFIIIFGSVLVIWITVNSIFLLLRPFDPFPFILLNLVLSCLAAVQAPIIMMSQNRQEAKDRLRAEHDYQVNLKAEIEIRQLHTKIDQLMNHSWQRLLEIQRVQIDLMEELAAVKKR